MSCPRQICRRIGASLLGLFCLALDAAPAPDTRADYLLQAWQSEDGLQHQVVTSVLQDQQGFIWLAAETALVRFDGVEFREYASPLIRSEKSARIRALVQEDASTLLIAPDIGGLVRLRNGQFATHPASAALSDLPVATLFTERGGAVWVGYLGGDVVRWEKGTLASFGTPEGLKGQWSSWAYDRAGDLWFANSTYLARYSNGVMHRVREEIGDRMCIAAARSGGIWIASNERLCRWENGQLSILAEAPPWAGSRVRTLYEDRSGNLWIGTSARGLYRFGRGTIDPVETSHPAVNSIREDHEGNLWVATHGGGLNRLRPRLFDLYDASTGLLDDISYSVHEDARGGLWIGNCDGGLARFERERFEILTRQPGWPPLRVFSVVTDRQGGAWIGTRTGLYFWNGEPETIPVRREEETIRDVHVLFCAANGDVWVGADPDVLGRFRGGRFQRFGREEGFRGNAVRAIAESSSGEIWLGTEAGELLGFHDQRFRTLTPEDGLPGNAVRALHVDEDGILWIGTSGGGLALRMDGRLYRISTGQGLPADVIFQLLLDDRGRMWFGSPAGLFHVSREALLECAVGKDDRVHAAVFGRSDGIASVSCLGGYQPTSAKSAGGRLWFATRQGLLKVDTAAENRNLRPPAVLLNECLADDVALRAGKRIKVPPGTRKLEFRFSVLSYTAPERVQVRHRLDGFDSEWVEAGSVRKVSYPRLTPGNYRLRVSACNNDGIWSDKGLELAFSVLPAWWQTSWFRLLAVLAFAVCIGLSVRYWSHRRLRLRLERLEHQQALEKERARIARDLHDDLGVSLTQIALLAEMSSDEALPPERRERNLKQVTRGARNLVRELDGILWTVNPKNDSLDKLASYLCQFSQQFFRPTSICCRFDVSDAIPAHPLSPDVRHDLFLIVKEAMNNVVKHSGATEVWLRLKAADGVFEVVIEDNGRGLSQETLQKSERNGMLNMRTRIEGLGGGFELRSGPSQGTTLRIRFPLIPQPTASNSNATLP